MRQHQRLQRRKGLAEYAQQGQPVGLGLKRYVHYRNIGIGMGVQICYRGTRRSH